ncbi:MAG: glycosyltransferase family 39 protein [Candidatus Coatesbacteria bacterium]|nr:MAG: glycosyltransferase family 39 protein [Candidatus Coatesbacteria bacterium]
MRELRFVAITVATTSILWASFILVIGTSAAESDQYEYRAAAERLASGLGLTYASGELYVHSHPPLYPVFLAGIFAAGGGGLAVRLVQLALALATLLVVYATARRAFGGRVAAAALIAGGLYLPTAFYATDVLSEILFTFLLAAGVYLLYARWERGGAAGFAAAGVVFGLAGLTRGVALAVAVALAAVILLRRGVPAGRRWLRAAAFGVGVAAAVAPWSAYVYRTTGYPVLLDTKTAHVFYLGNNAGTPAHHAWDATDGDYRFVVPPGLRETKNGFERSRLFFRAAAAYALAHPLQTAARFVSKFADMWELERLFAAEYRAGLFPAAREPWIFIWIAAEVAASAAALALFWAAVPLMSKNLWRTLTLAVVAATVVVFALTIAHPRYNYPLMVLGLPAVGYFFVELLPRLRARALPRGKLVLAVAAVASLAVIWARMAWLFLSRGT